MHAVKNEVPHTREVGPRQLQTLDFNNIALKLGVKTDSCQGRWTELDDQDLRILYALLNMDVLGDGTSPAKSSPALNILSEFCATAIQWAQRMKDSL